MQIDIEIFQNNNNLYIASCSGLNIHCYGQTVNKAVTRLKEVVEFYMQSARELGLSLEELCGWADKGQSRPTAIPLNREQRTCLTGKSLIN